jgi:hypothetical protein
VGTDAATVGAIIAGIKNLVLVKLLI